MLRRRALIVSLPLPNHAIFEQWIVHDVLFTTACQNIAHGWLSRNKDGKPSDISLYMITQKAFRL